MRGQRSCMCVFDTHTHARSSYAVAYWNINLSATASCVLYDPSALLREKAEGDVMQVTQHVHTSGPTLALLFSWSKALRHMTFREKKACQRRTEGSAKSKHVGNRCLRKKKRSRFPTTAPQLDHRSTEHVYSIHHA